MTMIVYVYRSRLWVSKWFLPFLDSDMNDLHMLQKKALMYELLFVEMFIYLVQPE